MSDPYRPLLLALLTAAGCTGGTDTGKAGETGETGDTARATELGCYSVTPDTTTCPDPTTVPVKDVLPETCGAVVVSVDGPGSVDGCAWIGGFAPAWCIYPITVIPPDEPCDYGRPLVLAGAPRLAPLVRRDGWGSAARTGRTTVAPPPAAPAADPARAATWARIGLAEHASVASFARLTLELLAAGAPAALVAEAQAAAQDEVRHAQLAFGLATHHAGSPVGPGPLPLADLSLRADLAELAASTVREGCIAETLSALQMALARDRAGDAAEHAALTVIARDEARHAAFAWRIVRWAIERGDASVRAAVEAAFAEAPPIPETAGGLLPVAVARESITRGWREVIQPAAAALLRGDRAEAAIG